MPGQNDALAGDGEYVSPSLESALWWMPDACARADEPVTLLSGENAVPHRSDAVIREARPGDGELLLEWVKKLAAFEYLSASVTADADTLEKCVITRKLANALFVETNGTVAAFAVWYLAYSTFSGKPVLYLEDIFVDEAFRGKKIASLVFDWLESRARAEGCAAMRWSVLDWNGGAKAFYASRGAKPAVEWEQYGLTL